MLKKVCHCPSGVIKYIPCNQTHDAGTDAYLCSPQEIRSLMHVAFAEQLDAQLSCGQVCRKRLATCTHTCTKSCHSGDCMDGAQCKKKVSVTCPCKHRKEEWVCKDVQDFKRNHAERFSKAKDLAEVVAVLGTTVASARTATGSDACTRSV